MSEPRGTRRVCLRAVAQLRRRRPRTAPQPVPAAPTSRPPAPVGRVVPFVARRLASAKDIVATGVPRCAKCRSTFMTLEPAFAHCHYCGAMTRLIGASLELQMDYELRSGLRVAS